MTSADSLGKEPQSAYDVAHRDYSVKIEPGKGTGKGKTIGTLSITSEDRAVTHKNKRSSLDHTLDQIVKCATSEGLSYKSIVSLHKLAQALDKEIHQDTELEALKPKVQKVLDTFEASGIQEIEAEVAEELSEDELHAQMVAGETVDDVLPASTKVCNSKSQPWT